MDATSKKLLEGAARAAGPEFVNLLSHGKWDPLLDDGQALRLAVKLDICWRRYGNILELCIPNHGYQRLLDEFVGDDKGAATRRAIVRAAAELGRKK